jgi:LacI family transcriptional regulator
MPTLADVAKVAGVGVMSVSRVVNGTRKVSKDTEERVRAAIKRIGYEPNEAARILKGHRAHVLGLIVPDIADPFFATCANAIQEAAREAGYLTIMVASAHKEAIERQQTELMMQRQIAGLVIVPMGSHYEHLQKANIGGLPVVSLDRPLQDGDADAVLVDNREASIRLAEHLLEHGHQHILCVTDEERIFTRVERLAGFTQTMRKAKLPARICVIGPTSGTFAEQFPSIMGSEPKPTAIFTLGDMITVEVLRHLQKTKVRMPQEMALVAFDEFDAASMVSPQITVVRQPVAELGRKAVTLLLRRIDGSEAGPTKQVIVPTELLIRESCGCRARAAGASAATKRTSAKKR